MRASLVLYAMAFGLTPAPALAQRGLLDHAESRIIGGEFPDARTLLERWRRENPTAARSDQEQMARYHVLSARTITSADSAEYNYLTVAVDYPTARVAPEALLRLAQARSTHGDTAQAAKYLERLLTDYPQSEWRPIAAVWLSWLTASGQNTAMCDRMRTINAGTNPETMQYFRNEQKRVCGSAVVAAARPEVTRAPAPPKPEAPKPIPTTPASATARVSIQIGAFRELNGARGLQRQLENAGFSDVRLVRVPGNQLIRVRIGKFENRAAAADVLARLANANFSAVLVTDANRETRVTNQ